MENDITPPETQSENEQTGGTDETAVPVTVKNDAPSTENTSTGVNNPSPASAPEAPVEEKDKAVGEAAAVSSAMVTDGEEKPRWLRRALLAVIIVVLLGGVAWAATKLSNTTSPVPPTAVKHDVPLVRVGLLTQFQPSLYPNDPNLSSQIDIDNQVFENLVQYQDKTKLEPQLAVSWTNPDNTTWVFKLRTGVKFHDGNLMTAKQVKASLEYPLSSDYAQYTGSFKSIEATDQNTVTITTKAPDPLLINKLAHLYIFDTDSKEIGQASTGTGPYVFKPGFTQSTSQIQLVAWDSYWGGRVYTRELNYTAYSKEADLAKAVKDGQVDFAVMNDALLAQQTQATGWQLASKPDLQINFLIANTQKPNSPLANLKVRQALYLAVDPAALLKVRANTTAAAPTQLVPKEVTGYDPSIKRPVMDTAKAKQLLAEAGYPNGFATTIVTSALTRPVVNELQKELAQVGVTVTTNEFSDSKSFFGAAFSGKADLVFIGYSTDLLDASDPLSNLAIDTPNYTNKQLDDLFQQSQTTTDAAQRIKLLQKMESTVMQDLPVLPLFQTPSNPILVRSNLVFSTQNYNSDTGLYFARVYSK